jgi:hypothetical protein
MAKTDKLKWLDTVVEHALPIGLAMSTVAGVAGYAVGRSYLDGWDLAAGISPLVFNREIQSVVLQGLSSGVIWFWLGFLAALSGSILLFGAVDFLVDKLLAWWAKRNLSKRLEDPSSPEPKSPLKRRLAVVLFLAYVPIAAAILWFLAARLLTEMPRRIGAHEFVALHVAATCRHPPRFLPPAPDLMASLREEGMLALSGYGWVEVHSPGLARSVQGWLLQIQGSTLLLLTPDGTHLLHFADRPFRLSSMVLPAGGPPTVCKGNTPAGSKPVFKGDDPG